MFFSLGCFVDKNFYKQPCDNHTNETSLMCCLLTHLGPDGSKTTSWIICSVDVIISCVWSSAYHFRFRVRMINSSKNKCPESLESWHTWKFKQSFITLSSFLGVEKWASQDYFDILNFAFSSFSFSSPPLTHSRDSECEMRDGRCYVKTCQRQMPHHNWEEFSVLPHIRIIRDFLDFFSKNSSC